MTTPDVAVKAKSQPKTFPAYALNKCLIGYGLINGIINGVIFWLLHLAQPDALFDQATLATDMAITSMFLGLILFAVAVPLTKHDLKTKSFLLPKKFDGLSKILPRNYVGSLLITGIFTSVVMASFTALIAFALPLPLELLPAALLKCVLCSLAGALSGYLAIMFTTRGYRKNLLVM